MEEVKNIHNKLLKRKEIIVKLESESNPGMINMQKKVAEKMKVDEELVIIKKINSRFGRNVFEVEVFVYDSAKDKSNTEPKIKVKEAKK